MQRVAFVGTGIMGKPMARRLLAAGHAVVTFNRTPERAADLVARGAAVAESPRAAAAGADVVVTMLPGAPELETVLAGDDGLLAGVRPGALYLDMETIAPDHARDVARRFRERGARPLDAPVSGGERGAIDGTLAIMAGGAQSDFDAALPLLQLLGENVVRVGDAGAGQIAKACNQLIVAATIEAVAEALALARVCGVDPARVRSALLGGFATSRILELHGQRMLDGNFVPGGAVKAHLKDRAIVTAAARDAGLELPVARAAFDRVQQLVDGGGGELDHSALYTLLVAERASAP